MAAEADGYPTSASPGWACPAASGYRQPRRLVHAGLEVDHLHRRARGALAEIVERGHGQDVAFGVVAVDRELHRVGVDQPVGPQEAVALEPDAVGEWPDGNE